MKDDRYSDAQIRAGQEILAQFIQSLKDSGDLPPAYTPSSHPFGYMNASNILALVVLQRNGGWVGDVVFKDVPKGLPEVTGTPESRPFASRQEALCAALARVYQLLLRPDPLEDVACAVLPELGGRPPLILGNHVIDIDYQRWR